MLKICAKCHEEFDTNIDKSVNKFHQHKQPTHTPTPWSIENDSDFPKQKVIKAEKSRIIAVIDDNDETDRGNAEFIVRAVNAHEEMVYALKRACRCFDAMGLSTDLKAWKLARKAIAKAEGK